MTQTLGDILGEALKSHNEFENVRHVLATHTMHIWCVLVNSQNQRQLIAGVKELRTVTSIGLKDAKDACECEEGMMVPYTIGVRLVSSGLFSETNPNIRHYKPFRIFC